MTVQLPLRRRVALAYGLVGLVLSLCFGIATIYIVADYEVIMLEEMLEGQSRDYLDRLDREPDAALPRSPAFSVYREDEAPAHLRGLPTGRVREIDGHDDLHAAAYGEPGHRVVLAVDIGRIERLEDYYLNVVLVILAAGIALSAWLGWLLSARTVAPVLSLADAVDALPVQPARTTLAAGLGPDEIGRLAAAIDGYQARLESADAKERAFFADASHELRTPIAVIQGAVEVMKDEPESSPAQRQRLARVERGLFELRALLEALLLSARGLPAATDEADVAARCRDILARLDAVGLDAGARIALEGPGAHVAGVPLRWVDAILEVLLLRTLTSAAGSRWTCIVAAEGLELRPAASDALAAGDGAVASDLGLGLVFVQRLCHSLGWRIEQRAGSGGAHVFLRFGP